MTAQEILKLIEEVDPSDTAKLDEIDARVWCYVNKITFVKMAGVGTFYQELPYGVRQHCPIDYPYTRSRDALKAIRPEGFTFDIKNLHVGWECMAFDMRDDSDGMWNNYEHGKICRLKTEELAELHAILQAIDYERNKA